jgi:hypothetical protein
MERWGEVMDIDVKTPLKKASQWLRKHWTGLVTAYVLVCAVTYFAIWAIVEPLGIPDNIDIERLPGLVKYRGFFQVILTLLIGSHLTLILELLFRRTIWKSYRVAYQAHTQGPGWWDWVFDGTPAGTTGEDRRMEAIRIKLGDDISPGIGVTYQAHVEGLGWMDWVSDGEQAGTTGLRKRMEAVRIKLTNAPPGYSVFYQPYVQGHGWMNWVSDGEEAGTTGESKRLEAIRILVVVP